MTLSEAVLEALDNLGVDARTADVLIYVKSHYDDVYKKHEKSFTSTLSRLRQARSGEPRRPKTTNPTKPVSVADYITWVGRDLEWLSGFASAHESVRMLNKVENLHKLLKGLKMWWDELGEEGAEG